MYVQYIWLDTLLKMTGFSELKCNRIIEYKKKKRKKEILGFSHSGGTVLCSMSKTLFPGCLVAFNPRKMLRL